MDFLEKVKIVAMGVFLAAGTYTIYDLAFNDRDASTDSVLALLRDPASVDATITQFSKNGRTGLTVPQLEKIESDCTKSVGRPCGNGFIRYTMNAIKANRIEVAVGSTITNESNRLYSFFDTSKNGCTYLGTMSETETFSTIAVDRKACQTADGGQLIEKVGYAIPLTQGIPIPEGTKLAMYRTVVVPFIGRIINPATSAEQMVKAIEDCKKDVACAKELPN